MLAKCQAMHNIFYSTRTHSAHVSTSPYDNKHSRGVCVCARAHGDICRTSTEHCCKP